MQLKIDKPKNTLARAGYNIKTSSEVPYRMYIWVRAHAFRESKGANFLPVISIPGKFFLRRTRLQIFCDEYHTQCYGSLTDPAGRAICECSPAVGFLKCCVRPYSRY